MKSSEYWKKRSEEIAARQFRKEDSLNERLKRDYSRSNRVIRKEIEAFYGKFAINNNITMVEAKKQLDKSELKEFKMTLEEFTELARNNADGRWTQVLNNVYYKTRISRYEALQIQIRQEVELLTAKQLIDLTELLAGTYVDAYHRTLFEIEKGTGFRTSFARVDERTLETVINKKWLGSDYSSRIWDNKTKLLRELETNLAQSFIRGDSLEKTTKLVQERMGVSYSRAEALVRTENAHILAESTFTGYEESGVVKKYQFLATMDSRTSRICRGMDGKVFKLSEKASGINYPPLHVRCRSTTTAYFDDDVPGTRIVKGDDGEAYYIPDDMTYEKWAEQRANQTQADAAIEKVKEKKLKELTT